MQINAVQKNANVARELVQSVDAMHAFGIFHSHFSCFNLLRAKSLWNLAFKFSYGEKPLQLVQQRSKCNTLDILLESCIVLAYSVLTLKCTYPSEYFALFNVKRYLLKQRTYVISLDAILI